MIGYSSCKGCINAGGDWECDHIHCHKGNSRKLFVYKKAGVMINHNFTDDVAITYATSRADAYKKFSKIYNLDITDVSEVWFNNNEIAILTDY